MAANIDHTATVRSVRQLRRVRGFYGAGTLLWAGCTAWVARTEPGSRQMWVSALLLVLFTGLWSVAAVSLWLRRSRATGPVPVHHAAPSRPALRGHARA